MNTRYDSFAPGSVFGIVGIGFKGKLLHSVGVGKNIADVRYKYLKTCIRVGAYMAVTAALLLPIAFARQMPAQTTGTIVLPPAEIRIDTASVQHTMTSGAGASWHAMGPSAFWYDGLLHRANRNSRGSGWGGNPPLEYTAAWEDLRNMARWLGMDFIRVEFDMKMYEPERGKFDWENADMQTLYRILDYCQENNADVFFTQMWSDVEWNAIAGAGRLQSAPRSVEDFAVGIATLAEYLVKTKHYTCIRWLCIVNEPGRPQSWWQGADGNGVSLMPALHAVRAELDKRGISVGLSAPDWSRMAANTPEFDFNDKVVAAFDAHNYSNYPSTNLQKVWAEMAHARGIPFFQSELGTSAGGDVSGNPASAAPKSYSNQLINAEKVIQGMNVGIDGFNRWSYTNRGDLDGQWQMVRTFDPLKWEYSQRATPEPVPYFTYGILTRFMAKHSSVLQADVNDAYLVAAGIRSPRGNLTIYVLSKSEADEDVTLRLANLPGTRTMYKYQVTGSSIEKEDFQMNPLQTFEVSGAEPTITDKLPAMSITVYSTYKLMHSDPGITAD